MNDILNVTVRTAGGKKMARKLRHEGSIPGIVYGSDKAPISVSIDTKELERVCYSSAFFSHVIDTDLGNGVEKILPRDIDFYPIIDKPSHVDFQRGSANSKIKANITIEFINEDKSPGMKKGGILNVVIHQLECICSATNIPEKIIFDLAGKDIGESLSLDDVSLPNGVVPTHRERDFIIATLVGSRTVSAGSSEGTETEAATKA